MRSFFPSRTAPLSIGHHHVVRVDLEESEGHCRTPALCTAPFRSPVSSTAAAQRPPRTNTIRPVLGRVLFWVARKSMSYSPFGTALPPWPSVIFNALAQPDTRPHNPPQPLTTTHLSHPCATLRAPLGPGTAPRQPPSTAFPRRLLNPRLLPPHPFPGPVRSSLWRRMARAGPSRCSSAIPRR